jgi:serine protease Do
MTRTLLPASLLVAAAFSLACAVSPARDPTAEPSLVADDAPVFDQRFRDIDPSELDLGRFWSEAPRERTTAGIPIHSRSFADVAERASDGVVNLYTRVLEQREAQVGVAPSDVLPFRIPVVSAFLDFVPFKLPIPFQSEAYSLGSGFFINEQGYILTNAHVVLNATDIRVVRAQRRNEHVARIIGIDRLTDTALLRIDPEPGLTALPLGDSDALGVGEMVIAMGNPLGLNHTVTSGLVSAKERIVNSGRPLLVDFLQTDSAINPGSSGGPLLNLHGEVVGINTAIAGDAQGIGFAIPINTVKIVVPLLITGRTERGWLGTSVRPLDPGEGVALGWVDSRAVVVDEVSAGSPAAQAGLEPNDVIVRVDGREVGGFVAFRRSVLALLPGQDVELTVFRSGELRELRSTLVRNPAAD